MTNSMRTEQDYIKDVEHQLKGVDYFSVGSCPSCDRCPDDPDWETHFSSSACASCGSTLAGDRGPAHGYIDNELCHFEVCVDCLMYHANGDMPDFTEL